MCLSSRKSAFCCFLNGLLLLDFALSASLSHFVKTFVRLVRHSFSSFGGNRNVAKSRNKNKKKKRFKGNTTTVCCFAVHIVIYHCVVLLISIFFSETKTITTIAATATLNNEMLLKRHFLPLVLLPFRGIFFFLPFLC